MKQSRFHQFHIRLLLTQGILVIAVLAIFAVIVTVKFTVDTRIEVYEEICSQRDALKSQVELNLVRVEAVMGQLGNDDVQQSISEGSFDAKAQYIIKNTPMITQIYVMDTKGVQCYKSSYLETLGDRSDRDYFKIAMSGKKNYSSVIISRSTNSPIVVYAIPIYHEEKICGVIGASIDLEFLSNLVAPADHAKAEIRYGFIVDRDGRVIAHPNEVFVSEMKELSGLEPVRLAISGQNGTSEYRFDNQEKLIAYDFMSQSNWGIFVQTPKSIAYEHVIAFRGVMGVTFVVIAVISIIMAIAVSRYFKRPVAEIINLIHTFEQKREFPMQCSLRDDEFGVIGDAFIKMAETVVTDQLELENRVEERTQELTIAMESLYETQTELEMSNHELENTLKELNVAQKQIIQSEKMMALGRMSSNFAHEVNTPLGTAITLVDFSQRSMEELIKQVVDKMPNEVKFKEDLLDFKEMAILIKKQLEAINGLFEAMIKTDFIGAYMNETNDRSLKNYLQVQMVDLQALLTDKGHQLMFDCHIKEDVNISYKDKLIQVIKILLQNSMQHGFAENDKGIIHISLEERDQSLILTYADNGCNLSENELNRLFEPYYKGDMSSEGKGLGLTIVYTLVTHFLNGTITCHNLSPAGLEYIIAIPRETL